ncbi:hypothetical protein AADZ84_00120 [Colwelliaceae bacterium MEBiC 14330]
MLFIAIILLLMIGLIHSYLGEKYLLIRLFKRTDLPKLLGSDLFTKQVLRFAWHLTTIAWWGFAAILAVLITPSIAIKNEILLIICMVFALSAILSLYFARGKHLSWLFFLIIAFAAYASVI